ncbi:MAG: IS91 family transposase [Alphaproteobacteria bacterium]|nr:IS91 family transposase [Alphaproteobacteria bacterium]
MREMRFTYNRRRPEDTILYQAIQEHWQSFASLAEQYQTRRPLPGYVRKEVDSYLGCGILAHGFLHLQCNGCQEKKLVAFSCKKRGFCPSCGARRMVETSAYLVDHVLPYTPYRQWVLSVPIALRYWLASRPRLVSEVYQIFSKAIDRYMRQKAKALGIPSCKTGAVTFVQRFGSALNLNCHYHSLFIDGVYHRPDPAKPPKFVALKSPTDQDIAGLVSEIATKTIRLLQKREYLKHDDDYSGGTDKDLFFEASPSQAAAVKASTLHLIALGERAGQKVRYIGKGFGSLGEAAKVKGRRTATVNGFSLHANLSLADPSKRASLEKLVRYMARSSVALQRLTRQDDGNYHYQLKSPWSRQTHVLLSPQELMEKLCALVPPPRAHLTRFSGVLSPNAKWRGQVIADFMRMQIETALGGEVPKPKTKRELSPGEKYDWAALLKRIYKIDMKVCEKCGGKLTLKAKILNAWEAEKILTTMGLMAARPPPIKPSMVVELL